MTLKNKKELEKKLYDEGYDVLAFWPDGSWANVGTGYAGEQDGVNPAFTLNRRSFYDTTKTEAQKMVRAIEKALKNGSFPLEEYDREED